MEHFKTILDTKGEEFIDKLLSCHVDVSCKVDGSAIQAVNNGGTVSYCKRSGTPDKAGPVIDELTLATNRIYLWQRILTVWIGVMRPKKRFAPRFSSECVSYIKSVQEQIF